MNENTAVTSAAKCGSLMEVAMDISGIPEPEFEHSNDFMFWKYGDNWYWDFVSNSEQRKMIYAEDKCAVDIRGRDLDNIARGNTNDILTAIYVERLIAENAVRSVNSFEQSNVEALVSTIEAQKYSYSDDFYEFIGSKIPSIEELYEIAKPALTGNPEPDYEGQGKIISLIEKAAADFVSRVPKIFDSFSKAVNSIADRINSGDNSPFILYKYGDKGSWFTKKTSASDAEYELGNIKTTEDESALLFYPSELSKIPRNELYDKLFAMRVIEDSKHIDPHIDNRGEFKKTAQFISDNAGEIDFAVSEYLMSIDDPFGIVMEVIENIGDGY